MELGNKIRTLRLKAGLTQEKLAEELNVSFQTISKWENNVCAPDNHHRVITFYKELVEANPEIAPNYLYLMDNLLADNRTQEVAEYLETYRTLEGRKEFLVTIYEAYIALAEHKVETAEQKLQELEESFPEDGGVMFELANYHAGQCHYEKAIYYFEKSFKLDTRPRYNDALEGMAIIYEIQGKYKEAIQCCDRMLQVLAEEWNFKEGEPVRVIVEEKQRLMELMNK